MTDCSKVYTEREEKVNAWTHGLGAIAVFAGILRLAECRMVQESGIAMAAAMFYGISLWFVFTVSAFYHGVKNPGLRLWCRHLDHIGIYFLIAGSYAPLLYVVSGDLTGVVIFSALLLCSVAGTAARLLNFKYIRILELVLYIIMGWCCVGIAGKLIRILTPQQLWLLVGGGIAYTVGVAAYLMRREFSHAVWHLFVLAGATLQFFAISGALDL